MAARPPAGGASPQFASLYVGDLNRDVTEAHLYDIFNAVGPVGSIRVCRDKTTRKSLGYAYVNFHNVADAERALDTLNYSSIKGRSCRLMWSQRDSSVRDRAVGNIYVKNLDVNIDNKALFDTFSIFGNILSCKVASHPDGTSKGHGFVQFETEESAADAIEKVNGVKVGELIVEVHEFKKREEEVKEGGFKNLYIKSFPKEWDNEKFKEIFGVFGELSASAVKTDWKGRPFGFVDFVSIADAQKCVSEMHLKEMRSPEQIEQDNESGKTLEKDQDGHPLHLLYVGQMQSKAERQAEWEKKSGGKAAKGSGKKGAGGGGYRSTKGNWDNNNNGGKGFGFPGMPPIMPPGALGMKGTPMVANPQQMMAMMSMMQAKGMQNPMAMMGKGLLGPAMGGDMMGKGGGQNWGGKGGGGDMMGKGGRFPAPPSGSGGPHLSASMLKNFPPAAQKQMIGEKLYQEVAKFQPDLAAKLTGMMLEMDNSELLMLLESQGRLKRQIDHALGVLTSQ